jgi:ABC-2 type transport system ATP-binding protein
MIAVQIENVTKRFGSHVAVDDLSLELPAETIYGFIGPNGSGKTTTLRMIMRILMPDEGTIRVFGAERYGAASDRVGYLPEERGLYKKMKVRDVLRFYAELKGFRDSRKSIDDWLERMDLADWGNKKVDTLSKGMQQKVQFIATVIAKPDLVLLDEPFTGLDPVNAVVIREAILDLKKNGATVLFSTHDMSVAEKMCDFIFMIHKGRKVLDGTLESIQNEFGSDTVRVRLGDPPHPSTPLSESERGAGGRGAVLDGLPGVQQVTNFGRWQELRLAPGHDPQRLLQALLERGPVTHFELARPSLHDIFLRVVGVEEAETVGA